MAKGEEVHRGVVGTNGGINLVVPSDLLYKCVVKHLYALRLSCGPTRVDEDSKVFASRLTHANFYFRFARHRVSDANELVIIYRGLIVELAYYLPIEDYNSLNLPPFVLYLIGIIVLILLAYKDGFDPGTTCNKVDLIRRAGRIKGNRDSTQGKDPEFGI